MKKIPLIVLFCFFIVCISGIIFINALDKEKINVLVYGVDGRNSDEIERSDAILLVNYNYNKSKIIVTSIPRDSYVKISCRNDNYDKINHAYAYGGENCLNKTVSNLFGIKNIKNVYFDFNNVINLINYFGLIDVVPMYSFCQSDEKGEITYCFEKNKKIQIDGNQALAYMRARKTLPSGDFDRIKNQRQIFRILINDFMKLSIIEKIKFYKYAKEIVKTDLRLQDFNVKKIINAQQIDVDEYTLKGEEYIDKYYYYKLDLFYLEKIKKYYI